jgi:sec-independent protein translocase protein TatC
LFLAGALFCFVIILPFAMTFLLGYKTGSLTPMITVGSYVDFCMKFILAFGAIFELPLAIIFLARFGIVSPGGLAKNRKYAILFSFIAAAILTPTPDAFNQTLMAVPIIILYEIGILLSRIIYRKKKNA